MFKLADELLKESKLTNELALKLGDELEERVAKRHGLFSTSDLISFLYPRG
jgi:hypothetical protein